MVLAFQTQTLLYVHVGDMAVNSPIRHLLIINFLFSPTDFNEIAMHKSRTTGTAFTVLLSLSQSQDPFEHSELRHMTPRPLRMGQH
jgi:hypothetical protein